ncbi:MAG: anthranilate phosphoribosyltransferase [Planctomycetaceae bacterium]|nr:anthranilate phosphoribosyltransferase [Planctomycetaceae bacterium]
MNHPQAYSAILSQVVNGEDLCAEQARAAFGAIMDGLWSEAQIAGLLVAMAVKGHTVDEIAGAATAMREHVTPINAGGRDVVDTCGTGGTGISTFNISTAAALVAAGAGVAVAKHGNRTHTRASGSADVLAALGVNIQASAETAARCLREAGVCFCFAVTCHPAMRYAGPVRKALAVRTIFNLLGPLTNPAGARRQVMGVFDPALTETIARVLASLGAVRAFVVHADDGLDEISTTCPTRVSELRDGHVVTCTAEPDDFGFARSKSEDLLVTSAAESAQVIQHVLAGKKGPARDIVLLNAAAAIAVADKADDIGAAVPIAARSVDSGAAAAALEKLIAVSNS